MAAARVANLTFQKPEQTGVLGLPVYEWFTAFAGRGSVKALRSLAHLPESFIPGCVLTFFGRTRGWSYRRSLLVRTAPGLPDGYL